MSKPLVSVVTSSYNQGRFLEETICSVLEQDYEPLEYIVVDDGSSDDSVEIIRRYADRLASWEVQENRGQAAALNRGFEHARGGLLGFVSSDDTLLPGAISRLALEFARDPGLLLAYGGADYMDEESRRVGSVPSLEWDLARFARTGIQPIPQPASLWSRRAWELAGPFDERSWALFDTELYLRIGAAGRVQRVPETIATFRLHPESKQLSRLGTMAEECLRFADGFFASPELPAALAPYARSGRASFYRRAALAFYAEGATGKARPLFLRSLALSPRGLTRGQLQRLVRTLVPERIVRRRRS